MTDPLGQTEFTRWYQDGKQMMQKLDAEISDYQTRIHELRSLRSRLTKLYPTDRNNRGGRPRKTQEAPA
jgi:hypothetical protein